MRKIIDNIVITISLTFVVAVMVYALYNTSRLDKQYEINTYRTVRTIRYDIVGTEKINKIKHIPDKFERVHEILTSTNRSHITTIQGKSGNKYTVRSKRFYSYAKDNKAVILNIKEKGFEQYQLLEKEVLDIVLVE